MVNLEILQNFLNVMASYNDMLDVLGYSFDIKEIPRKDNMTYEEVLKAIYPGLNRTDYEEIKEIKLIKLDDWKVSIANVITNWTFHGLLFAMHDSHKNTELEKTLSHYCNKNIFSNTASSLNVPLKNHTYLSNDFVKLLSEYIGDSVLNTFYIETPLEFLYAFSYDQLLLECNDKFLYFHFGTYD